MMETPVHMPQALTPQELAETCAQLMWRDDQASRHLDMNLVMIGPGSATLSMRVSDVMTNGHGTCHGGYIFTLADSAFAFACNSYNHRAVAQQASITFIAAAFRADTLTATAREVSRQERSGIYDVTVSNQEGKQIAEFRGHARKVKGTHLPDDAEKDGRQIRQGDV